MKYDPETLSLGFSSQEELEEFHSELVVLLRSAMVTATHPASVSSHGRFRKFMPKNPVISDRGRRIAA